MIAAELERLSVAGGHAALVAKELCRSAPILPSNVGSRCATVKIRTRPPHFIFPRESLRRDWQRQNSFREKSSRTTILSIWKLRAALPPSFRSLRRLSSSTTIPAAPRNSKPLLDAYLKAYACDPISAFGGVLAFNRIVDAANGRGSRKTFRGMYRGTRI